MWFSKIACFFTLLAVSKAANIPVGDNSTYPDEEVEGKIVGGTQTTINDYPYALSLQYLLSHICGGAVITPKYFLSAAHCFADFQAFLYTVRYGSSSHSSGGLVALVGDAYTHPDYNPDTIDYDIGVGCIIGSFKLSFITKPIALYQPDPVVGTLADVVGWGTEQEDATTIPDILRKAQVPIITNEKCQNQYGVNAITPRMICAGYQQGGIDSCAGDSGGPLVVEGQLTGLVSWGNGCAREGFAGVYSRVNTMQPWIVSVTGPL